MARQPISIFDFDPNVSPQGSQLWGVYDGSAFFVSPRRATIIAKANNRGECSVWELKDDVWHLVGRKRRVTDGTPCDLCNIPLRRVQHKHYGGVHTQVEGDWDWIRENYGKKIASPLRLVRLCAPCLANNGH